MNSKDIQQKRGGDSITAPLYRKAMLTMLIAELTASVTAIIDFMLAGRFLGGTALAAAGLGASPYFSIASVISCLLMVGSTNRCTRAVGKGDMEELNATFSLTMGLGVAISVLLGLCGSCFAGGFAMAFGASRASAEVYAETRNYLRGIFLGAPGFILFVILTPMLQLDGDSIRPKVASIVCGVVDVAGDLLNIFVFHGGMFGMALASVASHYAGLAVMLTHFLRKGNMLRFSLPQVRPAGVLPLLRDGLTGAATMLCRALLPILLNTLVLRLVGDMGVTALSAQNGSSYLPGALGWGIGGAVLMMGGMMAGEQNVTGLKTVVRCALRDILIGVVCLAAAVFLAAPYLAAIYIPSPGAMRDMAAAAIRFYALCLPFLAFNNAAANYCQSVSHRREAVLICIGIEVACPAAMAYLLSAFLGVTGVWMAFPAGQALLSVLIFARLALWKDGERSGVEAHMLLPRGFGAAPSDCIERSVHSMEEVIALSEEVSGFCAGHGVGKREAYRLALCIEEMAGNVIEHGFADGKPHRLDVRVLIGDGRITLRLRDDCALFDLKEKAARWAPDPEHPERNIGIRLVLAAAADIRYSAAMNTNNLIITISLRSEKGESGDGSISGP